jgi:hypothetical protein
MLTIQLYSMSHSLMVPSIVLLAVSSESVCIYLCRYVSIYVRILLQNYNELRLQNTGQCAYDIQD